MYCLYICVCACVDEVEEPREDEAEEPEEVEEVGEPEEVVKPQAMPQAKPQANELIQQPNLKSASELIGNNPPGPYKPAISKATRFYGVVLNIVLYYAVSYW